MECPGDKGDGLSVGQRLQQLHPPKKNVKPDHGRLSSKVEQLSAELPQMRYMLGDRQLDAPVEDDVAPSIPMPIPEDSSICAVMRMAPDSCRLLRLPSLPLIVFPY